MPGEMPRMPAALLQDVQDSRRVRRIWNQIPPQRVSAAIKRMVCIACCKTKKLWRECAQICRKCRICICLCADNFCIHTSMHSPVCSCKLVAVQPVGHTSGSVPHRDTRPCTECKLLTETTTRPARDSKAGLMCGDCAGSCIFWRDNVRLLLIITTIIHSVPVPMPAPTTFCALAQSQVTKVTLTSDSPRKMVSCLSLKQNSLQI